MQFTLTFLLTPLSRDHFGPPYRLQMLLIQSDHISIIHEGLPLRILHETQLRIWILVIQRLLQHPQLPVGQRFSQHPAHELPLPQVFIHLHAHLVVTLQSSLNLIQIVLFFVDVEPIVQLPTFFLAAVERVECGIGMQVAFKILLRLHLSKHFFPFTLILCLLLLLHPLLIVGIDIFIFILGELTQLGERTPLSPPALNSSFNCL